MRITYVPDTFPQVSETFVINEISWFADAGHEITVIPRAAGHADAWKYEQVERLRPRIHVLDQSGSVGLWAMPDSLMRAGSVKSGKRPRAVARHWQRARNVAEHAERIAARPTDVIICHFGYDNAVATSIAAKRVGVPVIQWFHGSDMYTIPHRKITHFGNSAAIVVSHSLYAKRLLRQLGVHQRFEMSGLGIDYKLFAGNGTNKRNEEPTVVCVARLGHNKNPMRGLRVFHQVVQDVPNADLWWIGSGPERERCEILAAELAISDNVRFLGSQPPHNVAELMQRAWVMMLLSDKEGSPVVLREAQAAGLPVVATDIGGVDELVVQGETGFLFGLDDPEVEQSASDQISKLLSDHVLRRSCSLKAQKHAEQFNMSIAYQPVMNLVKELTCDA